jgi:hypothetical protein
MLQLTSFNFATVIKSFYHHYPLPCTQGMLFIRSGVQLNRWLFWGKETV